MHQSFIEKLIKSVEILEVQSKIGRKVPEDQTTELRELIFSTYRIIYQVKQNEIKILTVVHQARLLDLQDLKEF